MVPTARARAASRAGGLSSGAAAHCGAEHPPRRVSLRGGGAPEHGPRRRRRAGRGGLGDAEEVLLRVAADLLHSPGAHRPAPTRCRQATVATRRPRPKLILRTTKQALRRVRSRFGAPSARETWRFRARRIRRCTAVPRRTCTGGRRWSVSRRRRRIAVAESLHRTRKRKANPAPGSPPRVLALGPKPPATAVPRRPRRRPARGLRVARRCSRCRLARCRQVRKRQGGRPSRFRH